MKFINCLFEKKNPKTLTAPFGGSQDASKHDEICNLSSKVWFVLPRRVLLVKAAVQTFLGYA